MTAMDDRAATCCAPLVARRAFVGSIQSIDPAITALAISSDLQTAATTRTYARARRPLAIRLRWQAVLISAMAVLISADVVAQEVASSEASFVAENQLAMDKMMKGMDVRPSGSIDRDFAAMMIPHHQGAIDMAMAELRHGRNERLRRIAQGIVVEQRQEIAAMQSVIDQELSRPGIPAPATPLQPNASPRPTSADATQPR